MPVRGDSQVAYDIDNLADNLAEKLSGQVSESLNLPASCYSTMFWVEAMRLAPEEQSSYHVYGIFHYPKKPNVARLEMALQLLVNTNYNLRTTFVTQPKESQGKELRGEELRQVIRNNQTVKLAYHSVSSDAQFDKVLNEAIEQPFDLACAPLFRFVLIFHEERQRTTFLPIFHHIILDGTQFDTLMEQISRYYQQPIDLLITDEAELEYLKEYLATEKELAEKNKNRVQFWIDKLSQYPLHIDFPTKKSSASQEVRRLFSLNQEVYARLQYFSAENDFSLFRVLRTVWAILISIYSNQEQLAISFPVNMRGKRYSALKGAFVNTPFYLFERAGSFLEHLKADQEDVALRNHWSVNRVDIISALKDREHDFSVSFSQSELFIHGPVLNVKPEHEPDRFVGGIGGAKLCFFYQEKDEELNYGLVGSSEWVDEALLKQLQQHFEVLLAKLLAEPNIFLKNLSCLSAEEHETIVYSWNKIAALNSNATIQELFESQVEKSPNSIALVFEDRSLSYLELNQKANQLAHYLRVNCQIQGDDLIALCLDRSEQTLIAIMGVLKSGAGYVPLDPGYPEGRLGSILNDANVKAVIANERHVGKLSSHKDKIIALDVPELQEQLSAEPLTNLEINIDSTNLAYVMYTSGTTGKPKGVTVEHGSLAAFALDNNYVSLEAGDNILGISDYAFDGSVFDFFVPLLNGASLQLANKLLVTDVDEFYTLVKKQKINYAFTTTALFQSYVSELKNPFALIENVLVGGERLNTDLASRFIKLSENTNVLHVYGPTETVVFATHCQLNSENVSIAPIGAPLRDKSCYILDRNMNPLPIGCIGELYIGGASVARGYLNQPELTAERFVISPFKKNERLYRTGDLVRYLPDGNIEFIGRNDSQVKIRGYRIELGEIESRLSCYPGVKQAVVKAWDASSGKYLVAYYVADRQLAESEILEDLSVHLPDYMVPAMLVHLERLPLNTNGKLDRKALQSPEWKSDSTYVAPRNDTEQQLCNIFAELFACPAESLDIHTNFFRMGGNSILAIRAAHQIREHFAVRFPIAEIFRTKTIEQLAKSIATISQDDIVIPVAELSGAERSIGYPLSFAQERLWFIEQYEQGTAAYHMPRVVRLAQSTSLEALTLALQAIVKRHQVLRTLIVQDEEGRDYQCLCETPLSIGMRTCETVTDYQRCLEEDIKAPFDLRADYPIRICLYELSAAKEYYLLINIHHIAGDGWSIEIFQKELLEFYEHYQLNKQLSLPTLPIQYKDFAVWQREYLSGDELEKQLNYWRNRLANYETLQLATDKPRPLQLSYTAKTFQFVLTPELSHQLRHLAQTQGCTLYTVLLAGFFVLLNKYSDQEDIVLGTPMSNRPHQSTKDLIGFFVNMLVQREQLDIEQPITHLIAQIHQHHTEAQEYQDIPFEKLVQELAQERDSSRHALFQVTFAVQSFGEKNEAFAQYFEAVDTAQVMTSCDLGCLIDDSQASLQGMMLYADALFEEATIKRIADHYCNILSQLVSEPEKSLKTYQALNYEEYQQIVYEWNANRYSTALEKNIGQLFETQVERTPDAIAVVCEGDTLTYRELNEKANQLAHFLRKSDVAAQMPVGICMERSPEMIVAILGILKSGGVCVPLNTAEPTERLLSIIDDTKLSTVLVSEKSKEQLAEHRAELFFVDIAQDFVEQVGNISHSLSINDLAFLVYTSGSTGLPKGVMLSHQVFARCDYWAREIFGFTSADRFLFKSIRAPEEFLFPLFIGAALVIAPAGAERDAALFVQTIEKNKISVANFTPSFLNVLLDRLDAEESSSLRHVFCAGEFLSAELRSKFYSHLSAELYNFYGLAEAPYTAYSRCSESKVSVSIGKPVDAKIYILNSTQQPVPIGVVGELHVGGIGLADGYLNQPKLTAERFVANPFEKGSRFYKTGDLVRYLADGNIEYLGRNDFQVKVRGFRVELGEVEHQLLQYPGIKQSVVIAQRPEGNTSREYLVGYYVADLPLDESAILDNLSGNLPDYMLPSRLVHLEKLPLNANGKLDRKALPQPESKNVATYLAPRSNIEQQICNIYAELFALPAESISIQDNFFRLGGNSILAIQVAHRLSRSFAIHIPVAEIFRANTIEHLAKFIETIAIPDVVIPLAQEATLYPLSFAQERLWFIEQYEQGAAAYHIPCLVRLAKDVSVEALLQALQSIVWRHEILRTLFVQDDAGKEYQTIKEAPLDIQIRRCETYNEYQQQLEVDVNKPFDLRAEYPIRVCLYETVQDNQRYLLLNMHHIASDGWSFEVLQEELIAFYEHYQLSEPLSLPQLSIQYKDFAVWQREYFSGDKLEKQLSYWRSRLTDYEILQLPTDRGRTTEVDYAGSSFTFSLAADLSKQLRTFAQARGCSLYTILLSGFYILLNKYSGQEDIVVGSPIANRHYESTKNLVGFFMNMLVQRERLDINQPIAYLISQIHQHLAEAQQHQDIPFEKLVQELDVERDTGRHPLFQVLFAVQSFGRKEEKAANYYEAVDISALHALTRFDLEFSIDDSQPILQGKVSYASSLFDEVTIQRWVKHYKNILVQMLSESDKPLRMYQALSSSEQRQLIYEWNRTAQPYPEHKTIQQLFEEQVERTPNHTALVFQDRRLTYRELNERANQLAHYLRSTYAINAEDLIALCVERTDEMIISILGVLKAGAAYVPIDHSYPDERISFILEDTRAKVVIAHQSYLATGGALENHPSTLILDAQETRPLLDQQVSTNPSASITSRNLAYVMYTSGTTGKPKGVMVEHRSVNNTIHSLKNVYQLSHGEKSAAFTSYAFDISVSEFFHVLLSGAELHILSDELRKDAALISAYIQSHAVHYLYLPPVLLSLFPRVEYPHLRGIIYGGESCDAATGTYWSGRTKLFNCYGPTEAAIYAMAKQVIDGDVHLIGKPIANTSAYVLDGDANPLPIGVVGELYLGGVGLARGYLNRPELTAEKFVSSPFEEGARLYKTGDLVRHLPDGNIEYLGRNDSQVKMRGFRIELGEIEYQLLQYPGIKQVAVLAQRDSSHKYLVAYYTAEQPLNESVILTDLANHLPDYMVPAVLVHLEKFPLNTSGKLDRKALRPPEWKQAVEYIAPRSNAERQICIVFGELFALSAESISVQANFFRLGGSSLLAMQVAHRLSRAFDIHFPIAEIFRAKTIEQLAKFVETIRTESIVIPIAQTSVAAQSANYPLSFAQERLWFIEQYERGTAAYHIPRLVRFKEELSLDALTSALQAIAQRHEVLRTVFVQDEAGKEYQSVQQTPLNVQIRKCKTSAEFQQQLKADVNRPFDLRSEYPIRVCVYELPDEHYLLVNTHHVAIDGWSIDIFQRELVAFYEHYHLSKPLSLPTLAIQYKDFAVWQRDYLSGDRFEKQLEYWRTRLSDSVPLRLPTDRPRPAQLSYAGRTFFFYLTPELSSQLRVFAQKHDRSLYVVLLSGFYVLMHQCSGQKDIILGTPTANRHYESIKDLIGYFVNVIAQREQLDVEQTIVQLMSQVHQHLIEVQRYQDFPFEKLLQELNVTRDIRLHPLFQVLFSVQSFGIKEEKYAQYFEPVEMTDTHPFAQFDLSCYVSTATPQFKGLFSYSTDLFDDATMQQLLQDYISILNQMVSESDKALSAYQPLGVRMKQAETFHHQPYALGLEAKVVYVAPQTELEKQVCQLFADIFALPVESVGTDADFFHLGGNSILATQLASRLSKLFGQHFPIVEIFRNRTVEKLTKWGNRTSSIVDGNDFVIPLRKGFGHPLFMLPGAWEEELMFLVAVSTNLKGDRPIYGIHSRVFDSDWTMPNTLRELAEAIFNSVRKIQPQGPYYFFGVCITSYLAVQLQQLAEEQGEPAGAVFILNSRPSFDAEFRPASALAKAQYYLNRAKNFCLTLEDLWAKIEKCYRFIKRTFFVSKNSLAEVKKYYRLLHTGDRTRLRSELHLLLSTDEDTAKSILNDWRVFFENDSHLYRFKQNLSNDRRSAEIAAILDEILL